MRESNGREGEEREINGGRNERDKRVRLTGGEINEINKGIR
jgi:hypothetical protein